MEPHHGVVPASLRTAPSEALPNTEFPNSVKTVSSNEKPPQIRVPFLRRPSETRLCHVHAQITPTDNLLSVFCSGSNTALVF